MVLVSTVIAVIPMVVVLVCARHTGLVRAFGAALSRAQLEHHPATTTTSDFAQ